MRALGMAIVVMVLAAPWAGQALAAPQALCFGARAEVTSQRITLLDLVENAQTLEEELRHKLAGVFVASSPALGQSRVVSGAVLRSLLAQADLPVGVTTLLPAKVEIWRASQTVSAQQIAEAFRRAAIERLGGKSGEVDVHSVSAGAEIVAPAGQLELVVRFIGGQLIGRTPAIVEVVVDGHKVKQARIVGDIDVYAPVAVASRSLARRQIIGPDDVELARINLAEASRDVATEPDQVIGMRTRGAVGMGQPLDMRWVEPAPLIQRGEIVNILAKAPGMRISTRGRAEETGFRGKVIRLTNLATKRAVNGRVSAPGEVIVDF